MSQPITPRAGAPCPRCVELPGGQNARLSRGTIQRVNLQGTRLSANPQRGLLCDHCGIIWQRKKAS